MSNILVIASRNQGKIKEFDKLLEPFKIEIKSIKDYPDCPEVIEDGDTFSQNAVKKAEAISRYLNLPALADDSGLEVDVIGGKPGVYSARYAGPHASDEENNQKLIEELRDIPVTDRMARFRCVLAVAIPGRQTWTCEGICEGTILSEPRGQQGFGYDPLFYLPDFNKTMAELSPEEKNAISHRGRATREFLQHIDELL